MWARRIASTLIFHLTCHVIVERSRLSVFLRFCPHLHALLQEPQRPQPRFLVAVDKTPCASAHWSGMSGCFANPTPNTVYEPNSYSCMKRGAHADQSP